MSRLRRLFNMGFRGTSSFSGGGGGGTNYKLNFLASNSPFVQFGSATIMVGDYVINFTCPSFTSGFYMAGQHNTGNNFIRLQNTQIQIRSFGGTTFNLPISQSVVGEDVTLTRIGSTITATIGATTIGSVVADTNNLAINALGTRSSGIFVNGEISALNLNNQWIGDFTQNNPATIFDTVGSNDGTLTTIGAGTPTWVAI